MPKRKRCEALGAPSRHVQGGKGRMQEAAYLYNLHSGLNACSQNSGRILTAASSPPCSLQLRAQLAEAVTFTEAALSEQQSGTSAPIDAPAPQGGSPDGPPAAAPHQVQEGTPGAWVVGGQAAAPRGRAPNNARMHPANKYYRDEPDFVVLAQLFPQLQKHITMAGKGPPLQSHCTVLFKLLPLLVVGGGGDQAAPLRARGGRRASRPVLAA